MGIHRLWSYILSSKETERKASHRIALRKTRVLVDGEAIYFAQYAGGYEEVYKECLAYLDDFRDAKVDLLFVFNCDIGHEGRQFKEELVEEKGVSALMQVVEVQESLLGRAPLGPSFKERYLPLAPLAVNQVKAAIRHARYDIKQSWGEKNAALAQLLSEEKEEDCAGILTDNSDFLVFEKCRCIPYACIQSGKERGDIEARVFTPSQVASGLGLTSMQYLDAVLLLGCDYTRHINHRLGLLAALEIEDVHNPEAIAEFLLTSAPKGLHLNKTFLALWEAHRSLRQAWDYASSLYALEQDPVIPSNLAEEGEEQQGEAMEEEKGAGGKKDVKSSSSVNKANLFKAVERRGLSPSIVEAYWYQKYVGPPSFEAIYPQGEGRPSVMHLLQPLRSRLFGLLGLPSITEITRDGTHFTEQKVDSISQKEDVVVLRRCLAGEVSEKDTFRALDLLVLQGYGHNKPMPGGDPLLVNLNRKTPHLYLAALALRVMVLSSHVCIADQAERITKSDFLALAATIVRRQSSRNQRREKEMMPSTLKGPAVIEAASISGWFCHTYSLITALVALLGARRDIITEPRDLFDVITFLNLQASPHEPDEQTMQLYNVAIEPIVKKGLDEAVVFRPADLPPRTWEDETPDPGAGRVEVMAANDMAAAEADDGSSRGGGATTAAEEEDDDDEILRTTKKVDAILDTVDMADHEPRSGRSQGLPILQYKDQIVKTIGNSLVTIIHGETGCGKSTQVPQYLLHGTPTSKIVVTQPTRLAAVGAAKRVATELNTELGQLVGYRIGGQGETSHQTRILFATAGWLLQLLVHTGQEKPSFTHVVIDEVHERSIDSDLLCLVMKMLLRKWSDGTVRLILMSATMQGGIFEDYFGRDLGAPVPRLSVGVKRYGVDEVYLEELSRAWPDVYHRRLSTSATLDSLIRKMGGRPDNIQPQIGPDALMLAVQLTRHITRPGDTCLVFVSGMSDIDELYKLLDAASNDGVGNRLEILICHSMISLEDQVKAFTPNQQCGRVIIATNMAESSVTLPDVKYVLDFGVCKRIVYDQREHRTVLKACWISKASAKQRAGRTGRVCRGTCVRFYPRCIYEALDGYDPPEMLTQPLEQVVLRMKMLDFGDVQDTLAQCVEPPNLEQVNNAVDSLFKMGALESAQQDAKVTSLGYIVSSLGLDLPVARTVVLGVVLGFPVEAAVLGAAIASQDPFIMPHPASSGNNDVHGFFQLMSKVTSARDRYAHDLGSDPICLMMLYAAWLRLDNEYERKSFLHHHGLVQTRMRSFDSVVRAILRSLSETGAVPSTWEMVTYLQSRQFEETLLSPQHLFLLRALLLGGFSGNLLSGHVKFKGTYDEGASRTLRIGGLPPGLQDPHAIGNAIGALGRIADIQIRDNQAFVVFDPTDEMYGHGQYDQQQQQVLYADEDAMGRFKGFASPVKALLNCRGHAGELILLRPRIGPGMQGYIPPGMPGYEYQESENYRGGRSTFIIRDIQPAATFNCKSVMSGKGVSLPKGSVLRNSVVARRDTGAPLYLVTSDIQKLVGKGDSASFRADNVTYLPYSEVLIALTIAAFAADQPVCLRKPLTNATAGRHEAKQNGNGVDPSSDSEDGVDYEGIEIGEPPWLHVKATLPSNIMKLINCFRSLVSACIEGKGKLTPSLEAYDLLMHFMSLGSPSSGDALKNQMTNRTIPEVYQVMEEKTTDVLPKFSRRTTPPASQLYPSSFGAGERRGVKRMHPDSSSVETLITAVAGLLPQYPEGIGDSNLNKRLRKMGLEPGPNFSLVLHQHGFHVQGNKILGAPRDGYGRQGGGGGMGGGSSSSGGAYGPDISFVLKQIEQRGAEGILLKTLWEEFMVFFKNQGVSKLKAVDRFLYRHGVTIRAERAYLNVPDHALPPVGSTSVYTAMTSMGGYLGGDGGASSGGMPPMALAAPSSSSSASGGHCGPAGGRGSNRGGRTYGRPDDGIQEVLHHLHVNPAGMTADHLWSLLRWDGSWLAKSRLNNEQDLLDFLAYHSIPVHNGVIHYSPPSAGSYNMNGAGAHLPPPPPLPSAASGMSQVSSLAAPVLALIQENGNGYRVDQLWGRLKRDKWWTLNARVPGLKSLLQFFERNNIPTQDGKAYLPGSIVPTAVKVSSKGGRIPAGERLWARAGQALVHMLAPAPKGLSIKEIYAKLKDIGVVGLGTEITSKPYLKTVLEGLPPESSIVVQELPELRVHYRPLGGR